jgi:hypothetical protein
MMRQSRRIPVIAIIILAVLRGVPAVAQSPQDEVREAVQALFDAMRDGDGDRAAALFHPEARLMSVVTTASGSALTSTPVGEFTRAVGSPREVVWDERISELSIRTDGGLATSWMNYSFYLGDQFSHCGVNAIQWARIETEWRIIQITDTRRTESCG